MSLPQKKRGFRAIVVDGKEFNWRLNTQLEICPVPNKDNKLIVDLGWVDPWLPMSDKVASAPGNNPKIVTPSFIRQAIEFALKNNWDIAAKTGTLKAEYRNNQFKIDKSPLP